MDAGGLWDDLLTAETRQALSGYLQLPERGELKAKWMPIMGRVQRTRRAAPMEILEGDEPREDMNT